MADDNSMALADVSMIDVSMTDVSEEVVSQTGSLWFDRLSKDIRLLIFDYVFRDGHGDLETQLDDASFHSQEVTTRTLVYKSESLKYSTELEKVHPVTLFVLPGFAQLFVSKVYMQEAVPMYARASYTYFNELPAPSYAPALVQPLPIIERTHIELCRLSKRLVVRTDDWDMWSSQDVANSIVKLFPNLTRIDVACTIPIMLASHPELNDYAYFCRRSNNAEHFTPPEWVFTQDEISHMLERSSVPSGLKNALMRGILATGGVDDDGDDYVDDENIVFQDAWMLSDCLKRSGWTGSLFYHIEFQCRMELPKQEEPPNSDPDSDADSAPELPESEPPALVNVKLEIDLSSGGHLVTATFTV